MYIIKGKGHNIKTEILRQIMDPHLDKQDKFERSVTPHSSDKDNMQTTPQRLIQEVDQMAQWFASHPLHTATLCCGSVSKPIGIINVSRLCFILVLFLSFFHCPFQYFGIYNFYIYLVLYRFEDQKNQCIKYFSLLFNFVCFFGALNNLYLNVELCINQHFIMFANKVSFMC